MSLKWWASMTVQISVAQVFQHTRFYTMATLKKRNDTQVKMGHVPETEHLQSTTVLSSILWSEKLMFLMKFLLWSATSPRYRQLFSRWCSSSVEVGGESCSPDRKMLSEEIIRKSRCTHAPRYPPFIPFHIHAYCFVTVMSSHWQTSCDKWIL